ncbi:MAG: methionyl-tRNA formyltransferase [Rubrivivax sp.]|nr:methionyl-tRNA formyltransferase [Rubrivivax sp.]
MKVVFAGTPEFARASLEALHSAGHDIVLVLTQPDRPAGRGLKLQASPVKAWALEHGLAVAQPRSLKLDGRFPDDAREARAALERAAPDVMIVAAYGLLLPPWVLVLPRLGCINVHASLLPRWRGAAPIHRAVEAGDARSGITIMQMDAGLDTGPMLLAESVDLAADETTGTLHDRLAALGGRLVVQALQLAAEGRLAPQAQPQAGITYAHKIDKAEARIDWSRPAAEIERRIRAFDPFPGAQTTLDGAVLKVWRARPLGDADPGVAAAPGTVLPSSEGGLAVACGDGPLALLEVQPAGGRRLDIRAFLRSREVAPGTRLG